MANTSYCSLSTPAVIIDMDAVEKNIAAMIAGAKKHKMTHRPHTKTHKSVLMAKKQLEMGACGITCAKIGEAEVMADSGIDDILIAFPIIGADKIERLIALKQRIKRLIVIANSLEGAAGLSEAAVAAGEVFDLLIEVDGGMNRGGVAPGEAVVAFANRIRHLAGINICGILYYDALANGSKGHAEVIAAAEREGENVRQSAELLRQAGFTMEILSAGSSYSAKYPEYLTGVTELRPGTYIYNDRSQLSIGMVTTAQCALRVM
ncbi:MAG TPA: alanine racemase, partial [Clostridia bacterium]